MTYATEYTDANNATLQQNIRMSIINAAIQIQNELKTTTNHANRVQLALSVLRDSATFAVIFAYAVVTQGVTAASTDAQIDTAVSSVWDAISAAQV